MQYIYIFAANKAYFTQTKCEHKHILYTKNYPMLLSYLFAFHIYFVCILFAHLFYIVIIITIIIFLFWCLPHRGCKNLHFLPKSIKEKTANYSWSVRWLFGEYLRQMFINTFFKLILQETRNSSRFFHFFLQSVLFKNYLQRQTKP